MLNIVKTSCRAIQEKKEGKSQQRERQRSRKVGTLNEVGLICKKASVKRGMIKRFILNSPFLDSIHQCLCLLICWDFRVEL